MRIKGEFGSQKHLLDNYCNDLIDLPNRVKDKRCTSENVNQLITHDRTQTTPKPKGNGGVEECTSDDKRLINSKCNDGTEEKGDDRECRLNELVIRAVVALSKISRMTSLNTLADLADNRESRDTYTTIKRKVVRSPTRISRKTLDTSSDVTTNKQFKEKATNLSNCRPRKTGIRFNLNGKIMFIIGLLLNNFLYTAATTGLPMTTLGSSVQLSWVYRTQDYKTIPIIQFQNQPNSFKELEIDGEKYELLLTKTDGQIKITFIVNNITDTDYSLYRCYLNNQPGEYKDINISLAGFTWMPTAREPVISTLRQDVELSWEYKTTKSINKIIFSRKHQITNHTIDIGIWTIEKGFKQDRVDVSTELILNKVSINNGGVERISLQLQQTVNDDFDKIYYCHVFYDDQISYKQGVQLVAERSECEGKNIKSDKNRSIFTWMYQYRYPITAVIISRIDSSRKEEDDLGYWYQNKFVSETLFKDRLVFNITELADDRREITLVLFNTTGSDFNSTYLCKVIPADGQFCQCRLKLNDVDDLNHDNYTAPTGITKPRDKIVSSINSSPIIVVAVIIPVLVIICILTTILVVRKRQKAPIPPQCNENEPCM
ncbi:uncharacterized protein LOC126812093 isoform X4 [Patella vulgata]|uniref:uncharacterized protein LOC126812093 isoform X4 n=1 Tax=Patella vulgata TaxID=6465 RepID=UPI0024A7CA17|nr:uncharacterized protein LOC126812093 isoform X4 [Patella vulgata]